MSRNSSCFDSIVGCIGIIGWGALIVGGIICLVTCAGNAFSNCSSQNNSSSTNSQTEKLYQVVNGKMRVYDAPSKESMQRQVDETNKYIRSHLQCPNPACYKLNELDQKKCIYCGTKLPEPTPWQKNQFPR